MSNTHPLMLGAGLAAAILFIVVTLVEICLRPGFSIEQHTISMLSLGDRGWLMVATFVICGILTLVFAVAVWQLSGARLAAGLLMVFGACCVLAGFFPTRGAQGFPLGTARNRLPDMDFSANLHLIIVSIGFGALILACLVLSTHYWRQREASLASGLLALGLIMPAIIIMGIEQCIPRNVAFYGAGVLGWQVIALIAWQELTGGEAASRGRNSHAAVTGLNRPRAQAARRWWPDWNSASGTGRPK